MYSLFEALAAFISKPRKLTKLSLPTEMSQFLEPVLSLGLGSSPNTLSPNMELTMKNIHVYYRFSNFVHGGGKMMALSHQLESQRTMKNFLNVIITLLLQVKDRQVILTSYELIWQELPWKLQYL